MSPRHLLHRYSGAAHMMHGAPGEGCARCAAAARCAAGAHAQLRRRQAALLHAGAPLTHAQPGWPGLSAGLCGKSVTACPAGAELQQPRKSHTRKRQTTRLQQPQSGRTQAWRGCQPANSAAHMITGSVQARFIAAERVRQSGSPCAGKLKQQAIQSHADRET